MTIRRQLRLLQATTLVMLAGFLFLAAAALEPFRAGGNLGEIAVERINVVAARGASAESREPSPETSTTLPSSSRRQRP